VTQTLERGEPTSQDEAAPGAARAPRWTLAAVAGLTALALALRFLIGLHSGLWRDEGLFLFVVDEPSWGAVLDFLRQHESHPPLFYAVMRVWLSLVGDTDAHAIAVPIVFGAAIVPTLYTVGARLLSWRVGLLAAALATFSPILVEYGTQVRPYSLLPLLALVATFSLVRAVDLGGRRRWLGYTAATLALVYTHNWGWLVLGAQWVALAVCLVRGVPRRRTVVVREWAAAQALIAVGFLPWLAAFAHQIAHAGHPASAVLVGARWPQDVVVVLLALGLDVLMGSVLPFGNGVLLGLLTAWALVLSAVAASWRQPERAAPPAASGTRTALTMLVVVPAAASCAAAVLSVRSDTMQPRCLSTVAPLVLLVVAHGIVQLTSHRLRLLALGAAIALLGAYAAQLPGLYGAPRSNARELAADLAPKVTSSDLLVLSPWWVASSVNRYYRPGTTQIDFPAFGRVGATPFDDAGRRIGDPAAFEEAKRRITENRAGGRRVWWVADTDLGRCTEPQCTQLTRQTDNFFTMGVARTSQLRAYLVQVYGTPTCDTTLYTKGRDERLELCLFVPR
jgi:hypothetical protein